MKTSLTVAVGLLVLVGCGNAIENSRGPDSQTHEPDAAGGTETETGAASGGGDTSSGGNSAGGAEAFSELPPCEPLVVLPITAGLNVILGGPVLNFRGLATVNAVDSAGVTLALGDSEDTLRIQAPQMPTSFASVGERLDVNFRSGGGSTEDVLIEVRREDGALIWLQVDALINEQKVAEMRFPLEWSLKPICSDVGVNSLAQHYTFLNQLLVSSTIDGKTVELHAWEEKLISLEGREYMMSVRFAQQFGDITCAPGDCFDLATPGEHLNVQVLAADLAAAL